MGGRNQLSSLLLWAAMAALVSQNLFIIPAISATAVVADQKTTYSYPSPPTDPGTPSTPSGHSPPSGGHHGGGSGSPPSSNCGTPPSGGHHTPTPSTPSYHNSPPSTPSYHNSPPSTPTPTPTTPIPTPTTPTPTTPTPFFGTPPTPIDPGTPSVPGISIPSPPFTPLTPPFTCIYWLNHPTLVWGILGWFGTVGGALGSSGSSSHVPGFGSNMSLMDALRNTRTDGYGELYREGTASFLNSMMPNARFPFSTQQVRDRFVASLSSNKAAANQAKIFKQANEGRVKH